MGGGIWSGMPAKAPAMPASWPSSPSVHCELFTASSVRSATELLSQTRGGGGWHKASVSDCLPLAAPIGLSPLLILTLCGSERVLVVCGGGGGIGTAAAPPSASDGNGLQSHRGRPGVHGHLFVAVGVPAPA